MALFKHFAFLSFLLFACTWPGGLTSPVSVPMSPRAAANVSVKAAAQTVDLHINQWAAIGDSFSAGPSTGGQYPKTATKCYATYGSYPVQLFNTFPYGKDDFQFLSCTGNVAQQMIDTQLPQIYPETQFMTLSIGGNDLDFSGVIKACVLRPMGFLHPRCSWALFKARETLNDDLENILANAYDRVFEKLGPDPRRKVFVQLYPTFFNEETDWCNDQSISIGVGEVKLTKGLRQRVNDLGREVTRKMTEIIEKYAEDHKQQWAENRIFYLDGKDEIYREHRICDRGLVDMDDPNIWFGTKSGPVFPNADGVTSSDIHNDTDTSELSFAMAYPLRGYDSEEEIAKGLDPPVPQPCANDSRYVTDLEFSLECDLSSLNGGRGYRSVYAIKMGNATTMNNTTKRDLKLSPRAPSRFYRLFHPTIDGYARVAVYNHNAVRFLAWPDEVHSDASQGELQCKGDRDFSWGGHYVTKERMLEVSNAHCHYMANNGLYPLTTGDVHMWVSLAKYDPATCPPLDPKDPGFVDLCRERMGVAIDQCDPNDEFKKGGQFFRDCVTWYIGAGAMYRQLKPDVTDSYNYRNLPAH